MPILKCEKCGKRMVTQDILEKHMVKSHSEPTVAAPVMENLNKIDEAILPVEETQPAEPKGEITPEAVNVEMVNVKLPDGSMVKVPANVIEKAPEVKQEDLDPNELVTIVSADNRELEVSVGTEVWRGKIIQVKRSMENEVRRLLNDGGYYVKN